MEYEKNKDIQLLTLSGTEYVLVRRKKYDELLDKLTATMQQSAEVLGRLTEAELRSPYDIQGYHVTGLEAVYQVVEHFGLHYGQITYIAKSLTNRDLGFYVELNKTGRAE